MKYPTLPHDDFYNDSTWEHVLTSGEYPSNKGFDPDKVVEVVYWNVDDSEGYSAHTAVGMFRMEGDYYVVYSAWTDTTGWGCQDDAYFEVCATREVAEQFGLTDSQRELFGIPHAQARPLNEVMGELRTTLVDMQKTTLLEVKENNASTD